VTNYKLCCWASNEAKQHATCDIYVLWYDRPGHIIFIQMFIDVDANIGMYFIILKLYFNYFPYKVFYVPSNIPQVPHNYDFYS